MQLHIVREEEMKRWSMIEVEEPGRVSSSFVRGYEHMMARIKA